MLTSIFTGSGVPMFTVGAQDARGQAAANNKLHLFIKTLPRVYHPSTSSG
jgi:hypothetical protein